MLNITVEPARDTFHFRKNEIERFGVNELFFQRWNPCYVGDTFYIKALGWDCECVQVRRWGHEINKDLKAMKPIIFFRVIRKGVEFARTKKNKDGQTDLPEEGDQG